MSKSGRECNEDQFVSDFMKCFISELIEELFTKKGFSCVPIHLSPILFPNIKRDKKEEGDKNEAWEKKEGYRQIPKLCGNDNKEEMLDIAAFVSSKVVRFLQWNVTGSSCGLPCIRGTIVTKTNKLVSLGNLMN